mgnify:CR=1 FL=1
MYQIWSLDLQERIKEDTLMEFVTLNTGAKMPLEGFGAMMFDPADAGKAEEVVYNAIKTGYRLIDTAASYMNEVQVGNAIRRAIKEGIVTREEIFVVSKLWVQDMTDEETAAKAIDTSLSNLGLDYIDLYLEHQAMGDYFAAWRAMEKAYKAGHLSKENINRRGYNKFLDMEGGTTVSINYDRIREDARWDGLKGYLTNTDIPTADVVSAYHNLWNVEKAFRIAKSKIEIRPMFHFTRRRIEAHICICFVALKVYKELERLLKLSGIRMSVDKVLNMAKTVTTISIYMPRNKKHLTKTMPMKRHKPIAQLFDEKFWGMQ